MRPSWITGTQAPEAASVSSCQRNAIRGSPATSAHEVELAAVERGADHGALAERHGHAAQRGAGGGGDLELARRTPSAPTARPTRREVTSRTARVSVMRARVEVGLAGQLVRDLGEPLEVLGLLGGAALGLAALQELGDVAADGLEQADEAGLGLARRARDEHDDADGHARRAQRQRGRRADPVGDAVLSRMSVRVAADVGLPQRHARHPGLARGSPSPTS